MMNPKMITLPVWTVGLAMTVAAAFVSLAMSWGVVDAHVGNDMVHTNSPLVEFRLGAIEAHLGNIETLLLESVPE